MLESNHTAFMLHVNLLLQFSLLPHLCLLLQVSQSPQANPSESLAWSSINLHPQIPPVLHAHMHQGILKSNEHHAKVPLQDLLDHTTILLNKRRTQLQKLYRGNRRMRNFLALWFASGVLMVHPATVNTNRSSVPLIFLTRVYSALLLFLYKWNQTMTQFCGKPCTIFCRPIHLQFQKETPQVWQEEET